MKHTVAKNKEDKVMLAIDNDALTYLSMVQTFPKGAPKPLKRLIRIRQNVFRELEAFNKELRRHKLA